MLNKYLVAHRSLVLIIPVLLAVAVASVGHVSAGSGQGALQNRRAETEIGRVPKALSTASFQGDVPSSQKLDMLIHFRSRDEAGLKALTEKLYDPSSAEYHHWLTPDEFGERFGRSKKEVNAAVEWLESQGLKVERKYSNRLAITFSGDAEHVQNAFGTQMGMFWDAAGSRSFFSNLHAPVLPAQLRDITLSLAGLNNAYLMHPATAPRKAAHTNTPKAQDSKRKRVKGIKPQGVPGDPNFMSPTDLSIAYGYKSLLDANIKGQGQRVAVLGISDVLDSDVTDFRNFFGLPSTTVVRFVPSGQTNPGVTSVGGLEAIIDVDAVSSAVPDAEIDLIIMQDTSTAHEEEAEQDLVDGAFGQIPVASESIVGCEQNFFDPGQEQIFAQAVAEGIAFFNSSGDEGNLNFCGTGAGINCPACYPGVTSVGGTQIQATFDQTSGILQSIQSEDVWNSGTQASGGGVSTMVPMPSYQVSAQGFSGGVPAGSMRVVPDVAALAGSPLALVFYQGSQELIGGTSFASPLWAGMMTLLNQFAGANQGSPNPALYSAGIVQYHNGGLQSFRDIVSGNSILNSQVSTCCSAAVGYDLATGWGSPNVAALTSSFSTGPSAPSVVATANSASSITITWSGTFLAGTTFNIKRLTSTTDPGTVIKTGATGSSFTDNTLISNHAYLYEVQAVPSSGSPSQYSALSTVSFATAYSLGISGVAAGQPVLAGQINSIRTAINLVLSATNESAQALNPISSGAVIHATDVTQMQQALNSAYLVLGEGMLFNGPSAGSPVRASDFTTVAVLTRAAN